MKKFVYAFIVLLICISSLAACDGGTKGTIPAETDKLSVSAAESSGTPEPYGELVEVVGVRWFAMDYQVKVEFKVPGDYTREMAMDLIANVTLVDSSGEKYKDGIIQEYLDPPKVYFRIYQLPEGAVLEGLSIEYAAPDGTVVHKDIDDSLIDKTIMLAADSAEG